MRIAFGNIDIQFLVGNFVAFFVFAVIRQTFLDCIVSEMHGA